MPDRHSIYGPPDVVEGMRRRLTAPFSAAAAMVAIRTTVGTRAGRRWVGRCVPQRSTVTLWGTVADTGEAVHGTREEIPWSVTA